MILFTYIFPFFNGIFHFQFLGSGKRFLERHFHRFHIFIKLREIFLIHHFHYFIFIGISIKKDIGIGRMVVLFMKVDKSFISELRNFLRISPRIIFIRRIGKLSNLIVQFNQVIWRRICSLHLIIDHANNLKLIFRVFDIIMPTFLTKNMWLLIDFREKNCVHIDSGKIIEILLVGAGYRIKSHIRICHCIDESVQRPFYQLHKSGFCRKIL